ncbi:12854_t:CDS:2, partial [Gigaspora rosea]
SCFVPLVFPNFSSLVILGSWSIFPVRGLWKVSLILLGRFLEYFFSTY